MVVGFRKLKILFWLLLPLGSGLGWWGWSSRNFQRELAAAQQLGEERRWGPAQRAFQELAGRWSGWGGGAVEFGLGRAIWEQGRRPEALAWLEKVPEGAECYPEAGFLRAEGLMDRGQLRGAEEILLGIGPLAGAPQSRFRVWAKLLRPQARLDELREVLNGAIDQGMDDPDGRKVLIGLLLELWLLDRGTIVPDEMRAALAYAAEHSPEDDRVWLGLARVALISGDIAESRRQLDRCRAKRFDGAVRRAWWDWSRAANRPEAAREAFEPLAEFAPSRAEWRAVRATFASWAPGGGAEAHLRSWLELEPWRSDVLESLAAGSAEDRRLKGKVDQAILEYRRLMDQHALEIPRERCLLLADASFRAGRYRDSLAWFRLAGPPRTAEDDRRLGELEDWKRELEVPAPSEMPWDEGVSYQAESPGLAAGQPDPPRFEDIAARVGVDFRHDNGETALRQVPECMSGGVGLLDYDRDGWLDIYCVQGGAFPPPSPAAFGDRLYRNRGDGTFEDVTARSGLSGFPGGYGHGVAVGDYDNDGFPDLFVTRWRQYALYRNRGDGTFEDVTGAVGLGGGRDWPTSAAFADLDNDGDLDLYVCHYLEWDAANPRICRDGRTQRIVSCNPLQMPALADHAFRNDGGRFVEVGEESGLRAVPGRGLGVVAGDFDGDRRVDLFVANDLSANRLYRNLGGFRFQEVGEIAGVASGSEGGYKAGMGVAAGDFDGDLLPDLAVTNFYSESTTLYRNLGSCAFTDVTAASGLKNVSRYLLGFGLIFADLDSDGRLDLVSANGHVSDNPPQPYAMPMQILLGQGGGRLRDAGAAAGPDIAEPRVARGLAVGDLDRDGRLDLIVLAQKAPLAILCNRGPTVGRGVALELRGVRSNRDGVGAEIRASAGGRAWAVQRWGGGSYQSASTPLVHLGVGEARRIDVLEVRWPSGREDRWEGLEAGHAYRIEEGSTAPPARMWSYPDDP